MDLASASPVYAGKAKLVGGHALVSALPVRTKIASIATLAGCHMNTVRSCLDEARVQYDKAHGVLTALNILSHSGFSRVDHVEYWDEDTEEFRADPALAHCKVIANGAPFLKRHKLTSEKVADELAIGFIPVRAALEGRRPVAEKFADKLFDYMLKLEPRLEKAKEVVR